MNQRKPNFLCIGAQKAGTTWLHRNLKVHPQVWFTPAKEIHYFDELYLDEKSNNNFEENRLENYRLQKLARDLKYNLNVKNNREINYNRLNFLARYALTENKDDLWYLSLFKDAKANCVVGDITPAYSVIPIQGIKHIKNILGEIKIIYIMRNPIKRSWSHILMEKRKSLLNNEIVSNEEWLELLQDNTVKIRSNYQNTIANYETVFNRDSILYLFYDEICLNPFVFLKQVCDFLEINFNKEYFNKSISDIFNSNPKITIPSKVEKFLIEEYRSQINWVQSRFNPPSFEL